MAEIKKYGYVPPSDKGWVYLVDANLSGELVEDMVIRLKSVKNGTCSYITAGGASKTVQQRLVKTQVKGSPS